MSWLYYASTSVLFFVILALLQRKISIDSKYPRAMSVVYNFFASCFAVFIFGFSGGFNNFALPKAKEAYVYLIVAVLCYGLYERGRFFVAKHLDASINAIISNIALVVAFVGATFLYGESVTTNKQVGAMLILVSLFLISWQKIRPKSFSVKGFFVGVLITVFAGIGWMLDKKGALHFTANNYVMLGWVLPLIIIYLPYTKINEIKFEIKRSFWGIVLMSFLNVVGYYLQLKAMEMGEATRVIPMVQSYAVITVIMGIIILKESEYFGRKIIAGVVAFIGSYFLVI